MPIAYPLVAGLPCMSLAFGPFLQQQMPQGETLLVRQSHRCRVLKGAYCVHSVIKLVLPIELQFGFEYLLIGI